MHLLSVLADEMQPLPVKCVLGVTIFYRIHGVICSFSFDSEVEPCPRIGTLTPLCE